MPLNMADDFEDDGDSFRARRIRRLFPPKRRPRLLVLIPTVLIAACAIWFVATLIYAAFVAVFG